MFVTVDGIILELNKFDASILELEGPVDKELVSQFESNFKVKLPNDYVMFIGAHNGINLNGNVVYGIYNKPDKYDLSGCYNFEHFEVENEMPEYLIPFSPDGGGNHYCFNINKSTLNSCEIVFWQHDYLYSETDSPEVVAQSFVEWFKEVVIDWTLEDINYDGTKKD